MKRNYLKYRSIIFAGILLTTLLSGNHISTAQIQNQQPLIGSLEHFSQDDALKSASWGFYAINTDTGEEVIAHNPQLALIPASAQKAVTTITALSLLGADYQFETLLQYDGIIENNTLKGNLYIKGTGDPSLGSSMLDDSLAIDRVFKKWLVDIRATGIKAIEGNIIADGSYFDDHMLPPKWMWEDIGNYYGAGAHALTIHENEYSVFFNPGRAEGDPVTVVDTQPQIPEMDFVNDVTTGAAGSGDQVYIYGSPYQSTRWLTGTTPLGEPGFEVRGSMPDPGKFTAGAFGEFLHNNKVKVSGEMLTHRNFSEQQLQNPRVTISRYLSPALTHLTSRTNFNSVNTYAEIFIKTLGKTELDKGSYTKGAEAITNFWKKYGLDMQGMRIHDGSGLSSFNTITVQQLTQILQFAAQDEALFESFTKGLPLANRSGSLARMFAGTPSAGKLIAKSGYLRHVRSYAGYTWCQNGHLIAFTFIVNNYEGSQLQMRGKMEVVMDGITRSAL